jgi:hypothetical protein
MRLASRSNVLARGIASYSAHDAVRKRQIAANTPTTNRREGPLLIEGLFFVFLHYVTQLF